MPDLSDKVSDKRLRELSARCRRLAYPTHPPIFIEIADELDRIIADRRTRPAASTMEGWRLVPEKSTDKMHKAYTKAKYEGPKPVVIPDLWAAMLAAAPIPPEVSKP